MNTFGGRPMTRSSRPRRAANLSDSVQHKLNMYALAASAAGVGALALAQPAEAQDRLHASPRQHRWPCEP